MAFDGNGNFIRVHNWTADAANGLDINASEMDGEDNGFATGLSNTVTRDGQGKMSTDFLPNADNTLNLGNGSFRWATINGLSINSIISGIYYKQTGAEATALVTPTNFTYPPYSAPRYMNATQLADWLAGGVGAIDQTSALQTLFKFLSIYIPTGTYPISGVLAGLSGQVITGDGPNLSVLKAVGSFPAASAMISWPSGLYSNVNLSDFALNGNAKAQNCLSLIGSSQGAVSNITLTNVQWANATAQQVIFDNVTYFEWDNCVGSGGTYTAYFVFCFNGVIRASTLHDGSVYAVGLVNCSEVIIDASTRVFNNPPGSGGTNSTGLVHLDSSYGCELNGTTLEAQGAGNVTAELVIDSPTGPNVSAHNRILNCNFNGLPNTKTNSVIIGLSGAAYVTRFENCRSIKPTSTSSLQVSSQQDTQVVNCADLSTYDAVPYTAMSITNTSGNTIFGAQQAGSFDFLQSNTRLLIGSNGTGIATKLKGTATLSAATSVNVVFGPTLSSNVYQVYLSQSATSTSPPWVTVKSTAQFTINFSAAFTGSVDWTLEF